MAGGFIEPPTDGLLPGAMILSLGKYVR